VSHTLNLGPGKKDPGLRPLEPGSFGTQVRLPSNLGPKDPGDRLLPTAAKHRFYHVFMEGEMKSLAQAAGCFTEIEEVYDDGNYVLFLRK